MEYYIGIDSGGTKTEFILADAEGSVISRAVDSGCNPLDIGVDPAREIILRNVRQLDAAAPGPICSIYAGIAGANHVDMHLETLLAQELGGAAVRVEDDRRIVVSSTLGHADGCGMICGTGSSLSIIIGNEPIRQVGGFIQRHAAIPAIGGLQHQQPLAQGGAEGIHQANARIGEYFL